MAIVNPGGSMSIRLNGITPVSWFFCIYRLVSEDGMLYQSKFPVKELELKSKEVKEVRVIKETLP